MSNILHAYVKAPVTEKMWITLGPEFRKDVEKTAVIVRALNGLMSAVAAFKSHRARCMKSLGYKSCKADPDLWLKPKNRPEDGVQYYSYLLHFVDDILCVHHNADNVLWLLHKSFQLNPGFGKPNMYFHVKLCEMR